LLYLACCLLFAILGLLLVFGLRKWLDSRIEIKAANRGLYLFHDGKQMRAVDPISVLTALEDHDKFRFDVHPQRVQEGDREATSILVDAVRKAFGVPVYSSPKTAGLIERECIELYWHFCHWLQLQKKSSRSEPT
jgi:hypothetical protein